MIFETLSVGALGTNCYILGSEGLGQAMIIDPGAEENKILRVLKKRNLSAAFVVNTHGHYDHIGSDDKFGVPIFVHKDDEPLLRDEGLNLSNFLDASYSVSSNIKILQDKEMIRLGEIALEVLHTPGHTPGGICLLMHSPQNNMLFSGDSLFFDGVGRTDFPGASHEQLLKSIKERLLVLPDNIRVFPGHGPYTSIARERKSNPYLS